MSVVEKFLTLSRFGPLESRDPRLKFRPRKFGTDGSGLKYQVGRCGELTNWQFSYTPKDPRSAWFACGYLAIGTRYCVGRVVFSAGGADADGCISPG